MKINALESNWTMLTMNRVVLLILVPLFATLLVACQSAEEAPQTAEERAQARWDHMIEREFQEAWAYYSPGFREITGAEAFEKLMRNRPVRWQEATVWGAACDGDRCQVTVEVSYRVPSAPAGMSSVEPSRELTETWIRTRDQWWYSPPN